MSRFHCLAVLCFASSIATSAELTTLDGKKMSGEIVSIVGSELTFKTATTQEKLPVTAINSITYGPTPTKPAAGKKYTTVELTDGSSFRCEGITIKGGVVEAKLLGSEGRTIAVPMRTLYAINREAGDLKLEQDFRTEISRRGKFDRFISKKQGKSDAGQPVERLDGISGTFGDGNAEAATVEFTPESAEKTQLRMSQVAGLIFAPPPAGMSAPAVCKVIDTDGNEYVAQAVARTDKGFSILTVTKVKVDLTEKAISQFDFAAGSVKYLSDLDPVAVEESGTEPHKYQRDRNLDRRPISLIVDPASGKKETYTKGLTLHAKTVLTYELKGQYKSFRAIVGIDADEENLAPSSVKITIDDGTQILFKGNLKTGDKPADLNLSVQGVDRLKITVESEGMGLDQGNQVSLANVRVLK